MLKFERFNITSENADGFFALEWDVRTLESKKEIVYGWPNCELPS